MAESWDLNFDLSSILMVNLQLNFTQGKWLNSGSLLANMCWG